jgi:hypothetical protein
MCLFKKRKTDNEMSNKQAVNLLFHIANNIHKIAENDEDVEVYIKAIDKAVGALIGR